MGQIRVPQKEVFDQDFFLVYNPHLWTRARAVCSNNPALVPGEAGASPAGSTTALL